VLLAQSPIYPCGWHVGAMVTHMSHIGRFEGPYPFA